MTNGLAISWESKKLTGVTDTLVSRLGLVHRTEPSFKSWSRWTGNNSTNRTGFSSSG